MALGEVEKFCFHLYWVPDDEEMQLRQISTRRPPNELIKRGLQVAEEKLAEGDFRESSSDSVYFGVVGASFFHAAGDPERNSIVDEFYFDDRTRIEGEAPLVGDKVAGWDPQSHDGSVTRTISAHHDKGWLTIDGPFYAPSDEKPDNWTG